MDVPRDAPCAVVDLDDFDANAADLVARAGGRPIRVASKSLRCRALIERALERPGFAGIMAYALAEALWLVRAGARDVFVAYPTADRSSLRDLAADEIARTQVTLCVDSGEGVAFVADAVGAGSGIRVAIDVDASLRLGPVHLGARRSPVRTPSDALAVARTAQRAGLTVVGALFYDAQVAGIPDGGLAVRWMKRRSLAELSSRRAAVLAALRGVADLEFVNVGGTGSLDRFGEDPAITEVAAGSGLYGSHLFDGYDRFTPRPALRLGFPAVRRPAPGWVTVFSGGYTASGAPGWSRVVRPVSPGLALSRTEGAGEVQTPLRGAAADAVSLGDLVWFRPAKAGEVLERFDQVYLLRDGAVVDVVPSYRGEGKNFG